MQNMRRKIPAVSAAAATALFTLFIASCSGSPGIKGKYADPDGSTVEFLNDGTAIFFIRGVQAIWTWSTFDGNRLKLEPTPGVPGPPPSAVCTYQLDGSMLRVTGCRYTMQLTRM